MDNATSTSPAAVVRSMLRITGDPVVTITAPLDRRRPGNDEDRIRIRNLLKHARDRLVDASSGAGGSRLVEELERALAGIDLRGAEGVFAMATPGRAEAHGLPFPVREDLAIASTPATRSLVQGLRRSPRYRVLVVSDRAMLYEAIRDHLVAIEDHGFPLEADIVPRDRRAVAGRFALEPGGDDKGQWRRFYREVDAALTEASRDDVLPVVLAGVKSSIALFAEVSSNTDHIVGGLEGSHAQTNIRELSDAAWQLMRERLEERRGAAKTDLVNGMHAGDAVTGLDEVWRYAREGRGRLLVVEENYRAEPSIEMDGRLVSAAIGAPQDAEVMEDPVDELIEHVVRADGKVEFLAEDALADFGRIGLMLR